ncbi:Ig-like domain-containing protein [Candidatus Marinimicrobia bacterium]|nr:Ig-like domain-containing protein [Candidatus Neomarinimicrobiota bacterium]
MRKIILLFSILFLWTCGGGGGDKTTGPQEPPIVINLTSLTGQAQKGPFNNGTSINVAELTNTLSPTGRNFSSAITDNTGRFSVANVQLESPYVELRANGFYFNEVSNELSEAQLTLYSLSNLTGKTSLNVNIITHLEKNRMITLMSGDNPQTFAQAKNNAQEAIFAIFDYSRANVPDSELLDISQGGAANAKLLAISAILQGDLTVAQMSELLANISTDIATDGTLDDASLRATLINNSKNLDMAQIRANLVARYASLGISATIADFETEINQFLKPPVVQDIGLSIDEDTTINITLTGSDPEGESITYSLVDDSNNATVTLNGNVASYTPDTHFNGTDTFTYKANDGTSDSNLGTVTISVNAVDDDPNTNDIAVTTDEDNAIDISLTADEYDGDSYSFAIITDVSNGTSSLNGTVITYTPNQDWNGTDTFTFEATDDRTARRNVATATITVNAINDTPTSSEVSGSSDEDTAIDITLSATDVDQDNLTYSIVSDVGNGTSSISGSTLTYTPNQDWNGTDTFTYKVNDGTVDSNTSNGTITIASINDAPIANDMTISTNETRFISLDITLDATDVDGDNLTYTIVSDASNATTTLSNNIITYIPTTDWNGSDSFTYKANDGTIDSNTATVTITVAAINDVPVVSDSTLTIDEDTTLILNDRGTDKQGNHVFRVTDVDSDLQYPNMGFSWWDIANSFDGSIGFEAYESGQYTIFTPTQDFNGTTTINYIATDSAGGQSSIATITLNINNIDDAPVANNITSSVDEDMTGHTVTIVGDSEGGSDVDGDALTFSIVTPPSNGSIYNDSGGGIPDGDALVAGDALTSSFTIYNPNANFNGSDTFTFKANDGALDSNVGTVTMNVNAVNDAPVASPISVATRENVPVNLGLSATDVDGSSIFTYAIQTPPTNGTIVTSDNIIFVYSPSTGFIGQDIATYTANDGTDDSDAANIVITTLTGSAPFSSNFTWDIAYVPSHSYAIELTNLASDPDGDPLTYVIDSQPDIGSVTLDGSTVTYTGDASQVGNTYSTSFTWHANDGANDSNIATMTIAADYTLGGFIVDVSEYDHDAYTSNFSSGLRTSQVSYLGARNTGSTGFFIESRAGDINLKQSTRDFDRFDYWQDDYSIELNFNETSLAWDYIIEDVNGFVPFAAYLHNNATGERIRLYAGYWDHDDSGTWNVTTQWAGPISGNISLEPIYCFVPADISNPYDPSKNGIYSATNDLTSSGGCGWSNSCGFTTPSGIVVEYPFVTAMLFVDTNTTGLAAPTAAHHTVLGTGYTSGSAIFFKTENSSSRSAQQEAFQIPMRYNEGWIEK